MTQFARVKDLFELPEHLSKSAFVLKLAEGVDEILRQTGSWSRAPVPSRPYRRYPPIEAELECEHEKAERAPVHGSGDETSGDLREATVAQKSEQGRDQPG
jgi:hypothetical protein